MDVPDESCRMCGGSLFEYSFCAVCKVVIQEICSKCGMKTSERFHLNCFVKIEKIQISSTHSIA